MADIEASLTIVTASPVVSGHEHLRNRSHDPSSRPPSGVRYVTPRKQVLPSNDSYLLATDENVSVRIAKIVQTLAWITPWYGIQSSEHDWLRIGNCFI